MKNYLILSGGAFRGAFQLGAVEVLKEKGIVFDKVFGVSTGAINGSLIAQDKFSTLSHFWEQIYINGQSEIFQPELGTFKDDKISVSLNQLRKVLLKNSFKSILGSRFKENLFENLNSIKGAFNMSPLKTKLEGSIDLNSFVSDFYFGTVDFNDGHYNLHSHKDFYNKESLIDGIVSSASMPVFVPPIPILRTQYKIHHNILDGGVRKSSPISDALKYVSNEEDVHFYIVNCNTGELQVDTKEKSATSILMRTIDIMMSQMFLQDLKLFKMANDIALSNLVSKYKYINYTLIEPKGNVLGDILSTNLIPMRYEIGRNVATKSLM